MNNYSYNPYQNQSYQSGMNSNSYPNYIPSQSSSAPGVGGSAQNNDYAEELLNKNLGKVLKVYMSFSDSIEWRDRIFEGTLEAWGRDFFLLNDKKNNKWYMVWTIYIDFIEFSEEVTL